MKKILILLLLIHFHGYTQNLPQNSLWKGCIVKDSSNTEVDIKRQDFIWIKYDTLLLFQFQELMSMETGIITIKTLVDTFLVTKSGNDLFYNLNFKKKNCKLEIIDENEFKIIRPKYIYTFRKIPGTEKPFLSIKQYKKFIVDSSLIEIDPITKKSTDNLIHTFRENGIAKYQELTSTSHWESDYIIIEFEGFVFLKGITSAPILLTIIDDYKLNALEIDYRFDPRKIFLINYDYYSDSLKESPKKEKPFELQLKDISIKECLSKLSDSTLNLEVSIAKGIIDNDYTVTQVQHAYQCNWIFFHGQQFDGFAKTTIKNLITLDSTICYIAEIPCGYYAERNKKNDTWYIYLHEDRAETDTSFIFKKAFRYDNTYRVINEVKNSNIVHYEDYYLDTRVLKKTWTYLNGKEIGITRFYDKNGRLIDEINNDK